MEMQGTNIGEPHLHLYPPVGMEDFLLDPWGFLLPSLRSVMAQKPSNSSDMSSGQGLSLGGGNISKTVIF